MGFARRFFFTAQLMLCALLPPVADGAAAAKLPPANPDSRELEGARSCLPREIRGGRDRHLNSEGELRLFFPDCLAVAAPLVLFRLKREGFSRCSVKVSDQGLLVRGRR
jgi:hypothetical protein